MGAAGGIQACNGGSAMAGPDEAAEKPRRGKKPKESGDEPEKLFMRLPGRLRKPLEVAATRHHRSNGGEIVAALEAWLTLHDVAFEPEPDPE
jgi:hypothetical protein